MRFIAALICLSFATAASAGDVKIYTPDAIYEIQATSFVSTVGATGSFTALNAKATQILGNGQSMKPIGYGNFTGSVVNTCGAAVTFQGCTLLDGKFGEGGLLHYEVYCDTQTGSF